MFGVWCVQAQCDVLTEWSEDLWWCAGPGLYLSLTGNRNMASLSPGRGERDNTVPGTILSTRCVFGQFDIQL